MRAQVTVSWKQQTHPRPSNGAPIVTDLTRCYSHNAKIMASMHFIGSCKQNRQQHHTTNTTPWPRNLVYLLPPRAYPVYMGVGVGV